MALKLPPEQFPVIFAALTALDGFKSATIDGRETFHVPFSFSAKTTWNKAKNIDIFQKLTTELEKNRQSVVAKYSGSKSKNVPDDKLQAFSDEWSAFIESAMDVSGVLLFDRQELNVFDPETNPKGNKIGSNTLQALMPLLKPEDNEAPV